MKTVHLCTSASWGGLELYACTVMAELQLAGCEVIGVCLRESKVEEFLSSHNVPVVAMPGLHTISLGSIRFLHSLVEEHGTEIVHAHFHKDIWPASLSLSRDKRRKLFLSIYLGVPKKKDILHRLIYNRVNGFFTSSQELCRKLPGLYPVPASKIHYLPYGRVMSKYGVDERRRTELRTAYGCRDGDFLVGTMVRIDPGKGVMDFARSYQYLGDAIKGRTKYLIIGEPTRKSGGNENGSPYESESESYFANLRIFIKENGLADRVLCVGYQSDLVGFLSALDVFVFPSRDELYSLVVLDAMAMGLPVVAAAAGGTLDQIVDQTNGVFYSSGDSREMAQKISEYLCSEELRINHGKRAREFVGEHHSMESMIRQLLEYYMRLS
jgi:D-inositol-3-phosphate glycosyltransferase